MSSFAVHNPHLNGKKAEVGVYPVEGSALWEMEEEDIREGLCSTQSSTVHFFFVLHIHTSYPSAESRCCGLRLAKLNSKLNRYRNIALFLWRTSSNSCNIKNITLLLLGFTEEKQSWGLKQIMFSSILVCWIDHKCDSKPNLRIWGFQVVIDRSPSLKWWWIFNRRKGNHHLSGEDILWEKEKDPWSLSRLLR